tara:strand:- start:64 stop:243 length:180 start_codon:yes stop_codon:yes gene_type:complete
MDAIKDKLQNDCQILIRYTFKRYIKRKAAKKEKKRLAKEAAELKKYPHLRNKRAATMKK